MQIMRSMTKTNFNSVREIDSIGDLQEGKKYKIFSEVNQLC